jgi:hypothetical protein
MDIETLLRQALTPVEPSHELELRLERRLTTLVELAAEELEAWELSAMRDPRKWPTIARPVVAGAVGGAAAVGLVIVRTQRKRHKRRAAANDPLDLAERTLRDFAHEAGRLIDEAGRRLR